MFPSINEIHIYSKPQGIKWFKNKDINITFNVCSNICSEEGFIESLIAEKYPDKHEDIAIKGRDIDII